MFRTTKFVHRALIVFLSTLLVAAYPSKIHAQPTFELPTIGDLVNPIVPPPSAIPDELYAQLLPSPVGDAFFDEWPAGLSTYRNGQIIGTPDDVTAVGQVFFPVAGGVRVVQLKFKTTDSFGADSFGTASLVIPNAPWTGGGARPLLVDEKPIDALGKACTPSFALRNGLTFATNQTDFLPPTSQAAILRNYAVLIPDHEGPRMSYAEPIVAGRITLDAIRAVQQYDSTYLSSAMVVNGYSGGAIATRGTALEVATYAPELVPHIRLAVMGGNPIDYEVLGWSMDGPINLASGVFHGATVGYLRSHPGGFAEANNLALQLAASPYKDACIIGEALIGTLIPTSILSNDGNPMHSDFARQVFAELKEILARPSPVPLYIFNGAQEFWIPSAPVRSFARSQCAAGVPVVYTEPPGEHLIAAAAAIPDQFAAIDRALQGGAPQSNCGAF